MLGKGTRLEAMTPTTSELIKVLRQLRLNLFVFKIMSGCSLSASLLVSRGNWLVFLFFPPKQISAGFPIYHSSSEMCRFSP